MLIFHCTGGKFVGEVMVNTRQTLRLVALNTGPTSNVLLVELRLFLWVVSASNECFVS